MLPSAHGWIYIGRWVDHATSFISFNNSQERANINIIFYLKILNNFFTPCPVLYQILRDARVNITEFTCLGFQEAYLLFGG